jgi:hypothetical protein
VFLHRRHGDHRESLVDFVEIDLARIPFHLFEELAHRAHGAVVNQPGSCACVEWPTTTARGDSPRFSALERRIITSAAAPSEIELELAAVTVPSLRNAGLSVGILSRLP